MGTRSPEIQWPARSPDMTPLDFFFWGFVKNAVYDLIPSSKNELIKKIKEVCSNIPANILKKCSTDNVLKRMTFCLSQNGQHFEHILKKNIK